MQKAFCIVLWLIFCTLPATATALDTVLSIPPGQAGAGQPLPLTVYIHNTLPDTRTATLPGALTVRLQPAGGLPPVTVTAAGDNPARIQVLPGHFHKARYNLILPPNLDGQVVLEVVNIKVTPVVLTATPLIIEKTETKVAKTDRPDALANNFFGHEPVYFLLGSDPTHAKFQISFKYRLLNPKGSLAKRWQRFENIYFGYTQTSFWDWESESAPFYDSSYKPELFYYRPDIPQDAVKWISRFSFQGGMLHESNGKAGSDSRSLNMAYLKPGFRIETGPRHHLTLAPRAWVYIGDLNDNPDIDRYRGHCDLEMAWESTDSWKLATTLRKGDGAGKGSLQFDATYPLREILLQNLDVYLHMQYFSGYAETLLSYDRSHDFFRIGFSMFR